MSPPARRPPRLLLALACCVLLAGTALPEPRAAVRAGTEAAGAGLLRGAGGLLVRDQALVRSDYLFVLNGKVGVRGRHAARLYRHGIAPRLLVTHTAELRPARKGRPAATVSELIAAAARRHGVPEGAIEIVPFPGGALNTRDEARALRRFLQLHPARRVTVVSTDYHTGRARLILAQELHGLPVEIRMAAAPRDDGVHPGNWWRSDDGVRTYTTEYLKLACALVYCR